MSLVSINNQLLRESLILLQKSQRLRLEIMQKQGYSPARIQHEAAQAVAVLRMLEALL